MNKRLIMIILSCVIGSFCCRSQSLSSVEEQYFDQRCVDSLVVCINPTDNNSTIICYHDSTDKRPNFVYHTHNGVGVSKRVQWPVIANIYGDITYRVKDMIIINDVCYFCGKKREVVGYEYSMEGYVIQVSQVTGFFGWFPVSQISVSGSSMLDLYLLDLPVAEGLKRMDGIFEAGNLNFGLVSDNTLVLLKDIGGSWACHVQNVASSERLEDVKITANHLVTLSRFLGSDFYTFGLRCETKADAFNSPVTHVLNNYYNGIKYNTLPMTTASLPNETPTRHQEDESMRMVKMPGADLVTVAYNGNYFDSGDCQHYRFYTPMYLMNLSNCSAGHVDIDMDDAQLLTTALLAPAQYSLLELCYVPTANNVALLQGMRTEVNGMWSILQLSSWNPSWTPQSVQTDNKVLKSMDVGANGWAYLAGWKMPDKDLLHFRQDEGNMERSCYSTRPATVTEILDGEAAEEPVIIEPSSVPVFTITQTHYRIASTELGYYPRCETSD